MPPSPLAVAAACLLPPPPLAVATVVLVGTAALVANAPHRTCEHMAHFGTDGRMQVCEACVLAYTECTFTTALRTDGPREWACAFSSWLAQKRTSASLARTPGGARAHTPGGPRTPLPDGSRMHRREGMHAAISLDQLRSVEINSLQVKRPSTPFPVCPRTLFGGGAPGALGLTEMWGAHACGWSVR